MSTAIEKVQRERWQVAQPVRVSLQDKRRAADAMRAAFPSPPEGSTRYWVSRARNADQSNPLYRLTTAFREAAADGQGSLVAEHVVAYMERVKAEIWSEAPACYRTAMLAEQIADGSEDVIQLRAMHDMSAIPEWCRRADEAVAAIRIAQAAAWRAYNAQEGA